MARNTVVVPYSSGEVLALLTDDGRQAWSENLSSIRRLDPLADIAQVRGLPVIDRDLVLAISHAGRMMAMDLRQGGRAWQAEIGGVEMPWAAGDYIFLVTNDSQLVCLRRSDGRIRWVTPLPRFADPENQEEPIRWRGPVLAGDRLIIAGSHGEVMSVSPYDGKLLGFITLSDGVAVPPVVANTYSARVAPPGRVLYGLLARSMSLRASVHEDPGDGRNGLSRLRDRSAIDRRGRKRGPCDGVVGAGMDARCRC